jgi:hypothetical protein
MLIDTCGHPRYLKTTLHGLTGYNPDYACLVVDGLNENIDATTKEVLGCALVLSVPVFVVLTKVCFSIIKSNHAEVLYCRKFDLAKDKRTKDQFENTVKSLLKLLMISSSTKLPVVVQNEDEAVVSVQNFVRARVIPIFLISCVSGENLDLLVKFLNLLPSRGSFVLPHQIMPTISTKSDVSYTSENTNVVEFPIEELFNVPSVSRFRITSIFYWQSIGRGRGWWSIDCWSNTMCSRPLCEQHRIPAFIFRSN